MDPTVARMTDKAGEKGMAASRRTSARRGKSDGGESPVAVEGRVGESWVKNEREHTAETAKRESLLCGTWACEVVPVRVSRGGGRRDIISL